MIGRRPPSRHNRSLAVRVAAATTRRRPKVESRLNADRPAHLRRLLGDIDSRLLALLTGDVHLDEAKLRTISLLETARGATLRLLAGSEGPEAG